MAEVLNVNPNTVTKSYRDLELMGIIRTRRGVGITIAPDAAKLCKKETSNMALARLRMAVSECYAAGIADSAIRKVFDAALTAKTYPYAPSV